MVHVQKTLLHSKQDTNLQSVHTKDEVLNIASVKEEQLEVDAYDDYIEPENVYIKEEVLNDIPAKEQLKVDAYEDCMKAGRIKVKELLDDVSIKKESMMYGVPEARRMHPIYDGKYFEIKSIDGSKVKVSCLLCNRELSAATNATTNLYTHLKRMHPDMIRTVQQHVSTLRKRKAPPCVDSAPSLSCGTSSSSSSSASKQQKTASWEHCLPVNTSQVKQEDVNASIADFVVQGIHPLSIVEEPAFAKIISTANSFMNVISRRELSKNLIEDGKQWKSFLKQRMANLAHICLTADVWSTGHRRFLCVSAHWIDEETFARGGGALSCRRLKGEHNYVRIAETMEDIMNDYNIAATKVVSTVTDNGSSLDKACKEFGVRAIDEAELGDDEENCLCDSDVDEGDCLRINDREGESDPSPSLLNHVRCASHTLSLIAATGAKEALKSSLLSAINHSTMRKCSALWNKSRRPKSAEIIHTKLGCKLRLPCPTRWNSLYESLSLLMKHESKLHELMTSLDLPTFKSHETQFVREYIAVLAPISTAIDRLQDDQNIFYGELLPTLLSVDNKLSLLQSEALTHCAPLLSAITQGFQKRYSDFLTLANSEQVNDAVIAAVSHPYFKLRWLEINKAWEAETQRELVKRRLVHAASATRLDDPHVGDNLSTESDGDEYFGFAKTTSSDQSISPTPAPTVDMHILTYLNDPDYTIQSLKKHPLIRSLFMQYNTTLPSSAPVHRLFSFAGITLPHRRNSLSDKTFERLILLRCNKQR